MANPDRIAEPFAVLMQAGGFSLNGLASTAGIPYSTLRRKLVSDPRSLTMRELLGIAEALKVSPETLVRGMTAAESSAA